MHQISISSISCMQKEEILKNLGVDFEARQFRLRGAAMKDLQRIIKKRTTLRTRSYRPQNARIGFLKWVLLYAMMTNPVKVQATEEWTYEELIQNGIREFRNGYWEEARISFERAHHLYPNARTLRALGMIAFEVRDYVVCVDYLTKALAENRKPLTSKQKNQVEDLLKRAKGYIGRLKLFMSPSSAQVAIDGQKVDSFKNGISLNPGKHLLAAEAPGYRKQTTRFNIRAGHSTTLELFLESQSIPQRTRVSLDSPNDDLSRNRKPASQENEEATSPRLLWTWVAGASALGFGGGAFAFWMAAKTEVDKIKEECERIEGCTESQLLDKDKASNRRLYETLTNVSLGISLVSLAAGGVLFFLEMPDEGNSDRQVMVHPNGVSIRGAF